MDSPPEEVDFVREMRTRSLAEGSVFWAFDDDLAIFDAELSQKISAQNFADLTLPDKLADVIRGRNGDPVSWRQVRASMTAQLRKLTDGESISRLADGMCALIEERLSRQADLTWAFQQIFTRSLLPTVIDGISPTDKARIVRDQDFKLARLVRTQSKSNAIWREVRSAFIQISAGNAVRKELRARAKGRRPRQVDLADPMVDMMPALGLDRAVDAVTTVLTAIAGPPGAAATSLLYELTRRPDWADRMTAELAPLTPKDFGGAPSQVVPLTHRFIKEVLRMWSPPLFLNRLVRTHLEVGDIHLKPGQRYLQSPYLIHHDPRNWKEPDTFDPDRWLPQAPHGPCSHASYIPFGWAPKACLGANLGTVQLIVLCFLMLTRYRLDVAQPEEMYMKLGAVPIPQKFHGTIRPR